MMKISNEKQIKSRIFFLLTIIFFDLIGLGSLLFIINSDINVLFITALVILLILTILMFLRLRYFIYENSGEVLSVKYFHPLKVRPLPVLEIPQKKLISIKIKKIIFGKKIEINIATRSGKKTFIYRVSGIKSRDIEAIKN